MLTQEISQEASYAINKDVERTFPGHPQFESRGGIEALRRVLLAFSVHNPEVGYCQSINFLAGFLLLLLSEPQAFWVLDCLVNELLPPEYYSRTLLGVHVDQRVLSHLVMELLPDVHATYEACGLSLHIVTAEWFMCCLCTSLPAHTAFRLWDALLLTGAEALFRVALALFALNRDKILSIANSSTHATAGTAVVLSGGAEKAAKGASASSGAGAGGAGAGGGAKGGGAKSGRVVVVGAGAGEEEKAVLQALSADPTAAAALPSLSPLVKGSSVRSAQSTFPALFAHVKEMPARAHDPDELLRMAFPLTPREAAASLDWRYLAKERMGKLRKAARNQAEAEQRESDAMRRRR